MARARKIEKFLSQPFFVAEQFTGMPGKYVEKADTVRGFQEILEGKHDDMPEQAFYLVGTIEEAQEKAKEEREQKAAEACSALMRGESGVLHQLLAVKRASCRIRADAVLAP